MRTRLLIFFSLCVVLCAKGYAQSVAVWHNGTIVSIAPVDSTEIVGKQGKPFVLVWSSDKLVFSNYADSLQLFPIGEEVIIPVSSVSLSSSELSIQLGQIEVLSATVLPENATDKTVTWSSSDPSVATVVDGKVTALTVGDAVITATSGDATATCTVKVNPIPVASITLDKDSAEVLVGEQFILTATVLPENATDKTVVWSSSDPSVATVEDGKVTALTVGDAVITATSGDATATCTVKVNPIPVASITLDKDSAEVMVGEQFTLTATVLPENATDKTIVWSSSDPSVATVEDGKVTALTVGDAVITATSGDAVATCAVKVNPIPVTSITLDKDSAEVMVGEQFTLTATVLPENATDKTVTWSSSDPSVASVEDGKVTALTVGEAVITATSGDAVGTCAVKVNPIPVTSITLDKDSAEVMVGEQFTLTATVLPENATDKTVTWSSSDPSVATVEDGTVTALAVGDAVITATSGDAVATCTVMVNPIPVTSVTLDKASAEVLVGEQFALTATVLPENATDKTVTWSSSDPSVATVEDGKVRALKVGDAVITATSGDATATCTVKVNPIPVASITLDKDSAEVMVGEQFTLTATVLPENATDKTVTWSSSDPSVASVEDGTVKGLKVGDAVITASVGGFSATCKVNVKTKGDNEDLEYEDWDI